MLIILGGLPATGKTTIARELAKRINAVHLRVDTIEAVVKSLQLQGDKVETAGYMVAYALARDNLLLGHSVIADSVNSISITREAWRNVAQSIPNNFIEIEIICSDKTIHQRRLAERTSDIVGLKQPSWEEVRCREYLPWDTCNITIDTSKFSIKECVAGIEVYLLKKQKSAI